MFELCLKDIKLNFVVCLDKPVGVVLPLTKTTFMSNAQLEKPLELHLSNMDKIEVDLLVGRQLRKACQD